MNIILKNEHLIPLGVDTDEAKYFVIADGIGFSTGDEVSGFNRANTAYVDAQANPYPKLDEAVLVLLPYLNKFETDVVVSELLTPIVRPLETITNPVVDYEDIRYEHECSHVGEGWYTVYGFLIDTEANPPATGVYYDTTDEKFYDVATGEEVQVYEMLERTDVESADTNVYITVKNEKVLHQLVGELTDISMLKGYDCKEYNTKQKTVHLWEGQISGGHVMFNDGYRNKSQQIIEDLENTDPYVQF